MTYAEKKKASEQLFAMVAAETVQETTPSVVTDALSGFATKLSSEPVERVPVLRDKFGLYGWCSDGVEEKIRHAGGSILFGWTIWEWPGVMMTAEFHAIWVDPSGALVDITPKPHGETSIIFVLDRRYPKSFDFDHRPGNQRVRTFAAPDCSHEVAKRIEQMKYSQRDYELRRASRAGKSLEEWMTAKHPVDMLPALIDDFLAACDEYDAKMESAPEVSIGHAIADSKLQRLAMRKMSLLQQIRTEIQQRSR